MTRRGLSRSIGLVLVIVVTILAHTCVWAQKPCPCVKIHITLLDGYYVLVHGLDSAKFWTDEGVDVYRFESCVKVRGKRYYRVSDEELYGFVVIGGAQVQVNVYVKGRGNVSREYTIETDDDGMYMHRERPCLK